MPSCNLGTSSQLTTTPTRGGVASLSLTTSNGCASSTDLITVNLNCNGQVTAIVPSQYDFVYKPNVGPQTKDGQVSAEASIIPSYVYYMHMRPACLFILCVVLEMCADRVCFKASLGLCWAVPPSIPSTPLLCRRLSHRSVALFSSPVSLKPVSLCVSCVKHRFAQSGPASAVNSTFTNAYVHDPSGSTTYSASALVDGGCATSTAAFTIRVFCDTQINIQMSGTGSGGVNYAAQWVPGTGGVGGSFATLTLDASSTTATSASWAPTPVPLVFHWQYNGVGPQPSVPLGSAGASITSFGPVTAPGVYEVQLAAHDPCGT